MGSSATFSQTRFRFRSDDGSESAATWLAAENTNISYYQDTQLRLRIKVDETTGSKGWSGLTFQLMVSKNGGAYSQVDLTSSNVKLVSSSNFVNQDDSTEQLTADTGTYLTNNSGMIDGDNTVVAAINSGSADQNFETEWSIVIIGSDVAVGDYLDFRVYQGGAAINSYVSTPRLTNLGAVPVQGEVLFAGQSELTVSASVNAVPGVPTLTQPTDTDVDISILPEFRFYAVDNDGDRLHYEIEIDTLETFIGGGRTSFYELYDGDYYFIRAICVNHSNGDLYFTVTDEGLYKVAGGVGTPVLVYEGSVQGCYVNSTNGDVFVADGTYVRKQTAGAGDFVANGVLTYGRHIYVNEATGDVFGTANNNGLTSLYVYKQTGGSGNFQSISSSSNIWSGVAVNSSSGDVYASRHNNSYIYMQTGGSGDFNVVSGLGYWEQLCIDQNTNDVYVANLMGGIYKQSGGSGSFSSLYTFSGYYCPAQWFDPETADHFSAPLLVTPSYEAWVYKSELLALLSKDSSVDTEFENITTPLDTAPFIEGDTIAVTLQTGDELDYETTYYWRVRAIDPSGTNQYGDWSDTYEFTTESATGTVNGEVSFNAESALTVSGSVTHQTLSGEVSFDAESALVVNGLTTHATHDGEVNFLSESSLSVDGSVTHITLSGEVNFSTESELTVEGHVAVVHIGEVSFGSESSLSVAGYVTHQVLDGEVSFGTESSIEIVASVDHISLSGEIEFSAESSLDAIGYVEHVVHDGEVFFESESELTVSGSTATVVSGQVSFDCESSLLVSSSVTHATLSGETLFSSESQLEVSASVQHITQNGITSFDTESNLSVEASVEHAVHSGEIDFQSDSELLVDGYVEHIVHSGEVSFSTESELSVTGTMSGFVSGVVGFYAESSMSVAGSVEHITLSGEVEFNTESSLIVSGGTAGFVDGSVLFSCESQSTVLATVIHAVHDGSILFDTESSLDVSGDVTQAILDGQVLFDSNSEVVVSGLVQHIVLSGSVEFVSQSEIEILSYVTHAVLDGICLMNAESELHVSRTMSYYAVISFDTLSELIVNGEIEYTKHPHYYYVQL